MKKILFICGQNKLRSPTAEAIFFAHDNWEVRSAGLKNDSDAQISTEDVSWADYIFVMENVQKRKLQNQFKDILNHQKIISLNIPDKYDYMDTAMIEILKHKVPALVR